MQDYIFAALGFGASVVSSITAAGITFGVMQNKVEQHEKAFDEVRLDHKDLQRDIAERYVPMDHFHSLEKRITEMQRDLRSVLMLVSSRGGNSRKNTDLT